METWVKFAESIIGSIAWPLCVIIVANIFKEPLFQIFERLKGVNVGSVSITLAEINELNEKILKNSKYNSISLTSSGQLYNKTIEISKTSPAAAVLYAYSELEKVIKEKIRKIDSTANTYLVNNLPRILLKNQKIDQETFYSINEMRKIRNAAGHEDLVINENTASEYGKNAELLINILEET
jgi:hypothetical protein